MICSHKDCFTCPYPDCIAKNDSEVVYKEKKKRGRKKMDPELKKQHQRIARHEYYLKNKEKVKAHQLKYYENHKKEICDKQKSQRLSGPILSSTIWINNGITNKRIKPVDFKKYQDLGWKRGRI